MVLRDQVDPIRYRTAIVVALILFGYSAPAFSGVDEVKLDLDEELALGLDGYWKVRSVFIGNLFLGQGDTADIGSQPPADPEGRLRGLNETSYFLHQARLSPHMRYGKWATLKADFDILDGVVWGDNAALAALPLFAGNPTNTGADGEPVDALAVRRLWLELNLPVGALRVGRMPSHWGMGLLANKGDGLDADFGDYSAGSTVDRILFATKPVVIVQTLMGVEEPEKTIGGNILMALAYDKTVDLAQADGEENPEQLCITCPPQILLSKPNDDVDQFIGVLLYKDEKANILGPDDIIQGGVYIVHRVQPLTRSKIWIIDAHLKLRLGPAGLESEVLVITGDTEAIEDGANPKKVDIKGGVVRGGFYYFDDLDVELEVGWAPGDSEPTDETFTGYPFHPDYNVGLLLYDQVLAARTARAWTKGSRGLWSKGGVWNSVYVHPKVRWRPVWVEGLTVVAGFLWARAEYDTNAVWYVSTEPTGVDLDLGYEFDLAIRYDFYKRLHAKLEAGVLIPGRALWKDVAPAEAHDLRITDEDRAAVAWTLQARLGFEL